MNNIKRHAISAGIAVALVSAIAATFFDESRATRDAYAIAHPARASDTALASAKALDGTTIAGARAPAVAAVHSHACTERSGSSTRASATQQGANGALCKRAAVALAATQEVNAHKNS